MKCYKHYAMDAVSSCVDCGKGLCPDCTNRFTVPTCDSCILVHANETRALFVRNTVLMVVLFIAGFIFNRSASESIVVGILGGYFFAGIPLGWSMLSRLTSEFFLFLSIPGWLVYFMIKLFLSSIIGMFVTPFKIYQVVKGLKDVKDLEEYTKKTG